MQELESVIQFNQVCLGASRGRTRKNNVIYRMNKDASGRIMFLPSWWRDRFRYAANLLNSCQSIVPKIDWNPIIPEWPDTWKRKVGTKGKRDVYALHEAYRPGSTITVKAVVPNDMSINDFTRLLETVGTYRGISPFKGQDETYGTFSVVSVSKIR